ncbi:MAG: hypothetical protein AAGK32_06860 [Actinomycetota bacterium]
MSAGSTPRDDGPAPDSGDHPDELLSALASEEGLDSPEVVEAARHVDGCERCAAIVDDERAVRGMLGDLPEVDPPDRFFPDLIKRRHRAAITVASAGVLAAVALWGIVVSDTSGVTGRVVPDVESLRARHMDAVAEDAAFEKMDDGEGMPAPYAEPVVLGGTFEMVDRFHGVEGVVHVTYSDGSRRLSLFEQAGQLDEDDLPGEMAPVDLGDGGYEIAGGPVRVVVVRRGDLVYTLVGDVDRVVIENAVADLPAERPMGMARRVTIAVDDLIEDLGLGL